MLVLIGVRIDSRNTTPCPFITVSNSVGNVLFSVQCLNSCQHLLRMTLQELHKTFTDLINFPMENDSVIEPRSTVDFSQVREQCCNVGVGGGNS